MRPIDGGPIRHRLPPWRAQTTKQAFAQRSPIMQMSIGWWRVILGRSIYAGAS